VKYLYLLISILFIASCSDNISPHIEEVESNFKFQINENEFITIEGDNINYEVAQRIVESIENSLDEEIELSPIKGQTQKAGAEVAFTEFPWWDGSYYWENYQDLDITYQTYTVAFVNPGFGDLIMIYHREIKKGNPVIPFFKWHWQNNAMPIIIDGEKKEYLMTCVKAELLGPRPFTKNSLEFKAVETRHFSKYNPCILKDNDEVPILIIDVTE